MKKVKVSVMLSQLAAVLGTRCQHCERAYIVRTSANDTKFFLAILHMCDESIYDVNMQFENPLEAIEDDLWSIS